jgi:hypothetical protein
MLRQATWLLTVRPCPHSSMRQAESSNCNILGHARTANKLAQRATEHAPGDLLPGLRNILGHQRKGLVRSWAYPGSKKNGMKNRISWSKTGYRKFGRTNAPPFSVPLPIYSVPFSVPFPFILQKPETDGKNGIRLRTERDSSRLFSSLTFGGGHAIRGRLPTQNMRLISHRKRNLQKNLQSLLTKKSYNLIFIPLFTIWEPVILNFVWNLIFRLF